MFYGFLEFLFQMVISFSCSVHEDRVWICGSRDSPYACDSYDANWQHRSEQNTIYAHSYGSMVSAPTKGLTIIGNLGGVPFILMRF